MLSRLLGLVLGAALLVLALTLSLLFFAIVAAGGLLAWGYLWWRTRKLRAELRRQRDQRPPDGFVIEGEVIRDVKSDELIKR